ncbi:MAG TPA: mechanosensitive ion channel family protein [Bosea sp. (in: a-proteobacteria)]|jgi:small-conductance mechanosensitive channel|uniref:mechanosensitive ion channel family protein n=1 Tax=Bosea sp. (in: a-proteobacteria) TaxID=1871050 RepID=UPI002E13B5AB|nr:mechanosensitive ion channel family protein [Bosea sp. (in: a-proteobacteria)]
MTKQGIRQRARAATPRWLAAAALAALCALSPNRAPAQAEGPVTLNLRGDEAPETVRKLVDALATGGRKVEIRLAAPEAPAPAASKPATTATPAPPAPAAPPSATAAAETRIEELWDHFVEGFDHGNAAIPHVVELPSEWERGWAANRNGASGPSAGLRILAGVAIALAGALLFRMLTARWFARRLQPAGPEFTARLLASGYGLLQDMACIALALALARLTRVFWLPDADLAMTTFATAANGAAIGATYIAVGRFLVAPGAPERRLLPLPRADRHFSILTIYAIATPIIVTSALLLQEVANRQALAGLVAITSIAITLFKVWWFYDARHDLTALVLRYEPVPSHGLRLLAAITPWVYIASAIAIWMVGRAAPMMTGGGRFVEAASLSQIIIVLAPVVAVGVTALIACRQAKQAAIAPPSPMTKAAGTAFRAAAGGLIWVGGLYVMARLWAGFLLGVSSAQFADFTRQAAGLALLVFLGWVAMVFLRAFFDAYTPRRPGSGPIDEDAAVEASVPSRLATVMPVLRGVVLAAVVGLTGLVVLSRLGVDIGPLLAGFGILGLAISFGSQALVRDIVSGFFFMLEDAFRVGEYVDTGRLKGTVEKISLRSIQMRHQSGQIHTIPFGQIQSLTNASRDWATIKFNVRLDHSADLEQARKAIKKVGLALLDDPEFGPHFIAQLKMQGVADITDTAVVIRLKFTSKPAYSSMLQRESLKRVYRALNEAHIPFASNAVTVRGGEGGAPSGAAATMATLPPNPLAPAAG